MTRYDAVNYISHGIAKRPGMSDTSKSPRGADEEEQRDGKEGKDGSRVQEEGRRARGLLRQPQQEGQGRPHRSADRPHRRGRADHPGPVPPPEEQPAAGRRPRRRQDRHRRGARPQDHQERGARGPGRRHRLLARHGHAAGRHALPRRLRGAAEAGDEGDREAQERDPVHRRDPHGDRRRRHLGRRHGRVEPAQARPGAGVAALHRLDHLQGIPPVFREGPGPRPPLPEDRRQRAVDPRRRRDHEGAQALFRGVPQGQVHHRGGEGRGGTVGPLHQRPQAARQGDRRDRRDGREPDAAARAEPQEDDRHQGDRGDHRHHGADPAQDRVEGRRRGAGAISTRP